MQKHHCKCCDPAMSFLPHSVGVWGQMVLRSRCVSWLHFFACNMQVGRLHAFCLQSEVFLQKYRSTARTLELLPIAQGYRRQKSAPRRIHDPGLGFWVAPGRRDVNSVVCISQSLFFDTPHRGVSLGSLRRPPWHHFSDHSILREAHVESCNQYTEEIIQTFQVY